MKNTSFKKIVVIITAIIAINLTANAQVRGDVAVGGYWGIGTGYYYNNGGIGAKLLYNVTNRIRLAAEIDYWRKIREENSNVSNLNMYVHILPSNRNKRAFAYPFIGVGRERRKHSGFYSNTSYSITPLYGSGIDVKIFPKLTLNCEFRIHQVQQFIYGGSLNFAGGLMYTF